MTTPILPHAHARWLFVRHWHCSLPARPQAKKRIRDELSDALSVSGSVGDGPIVNALLRVENGAGALVLTDSSSRATYEIAIPDDTLMPVFIPDSLTCSSAVGNVVEMISVSVNGVLQLSWVAPTENIDGSALLSLAGFRIYYGVVSRGYFDWVELNDPNATQHDLIVPLGTYYVSVTALDAEGNESAYSNELVKESI